MSIRSKLIRIASKNPDLRSRILPILKEGREFSNQKQLQEYLREHPKADPRNHWIKQPTAPTEKKTPEKGFKIPKVIKPKVTPKEMEEKRIIPKDLKQYGPDAKPEDLKPEHREAIKEYNLEVVGHDAAQAVAIAKEIRKGLDDVSHWKDEEGKPLDYCKMRPKSCRGNLGLTRDKMPQIEGGKTVKQMLESKDPLDKKKGEAMVQAGANPNSNATILDQMLSHLKKNGVKTHDTKIPVGMLMATQQEIKAKKTFEMADAYLKGKFKNIDDSVVVSRDGHILDGHHRWSALLTIDPKRTMNVRVVDMDMKDLLKEAEAIPGVYKANIEGDPLDEKDQKAYKAQAKSKFKAIPGKKASDVQASFNKDLDRERRAQELALIRLASLNPGLRSALRPALARIFVDRAVRKMLAALPEHKVTTNREDYTGEDGNTSIVRTNQDMGPLNRIR